MSSFRKIFGTVKNNSGKIFYVLGLPVWRKEKAERKTRYSFLGIPVYAKKQKGYRTVQRVLFVRWSRVDTDRRFNDLLKQNLRVEGLLKDSQRQIASLKNDLAAVRREQSSGLAAVRKEQSDIQKNVGNVAKRVTGPTYFSKFEIATRTERGLCQMTEEKDFYERYTRLIRGLPPQSVETVFTIIQRLKRIASASAPMDIFCKEEKAQLEVVDRFRQSVTMLNEELFCYNKYFLPTKHFEESVFLYRHGLDFVRDLSRIKNKAILDIGGFIGDSILILSELTDDKVYSFEATSQNYALMLKTIELNGIQNAVPVHSAVGSESGTLEIRFNGSASSVDEIMVKNPDHIETCNVIRIDDYVEEHGINVGLIKVDIEGAEQDFLKGALGTIRKYKPVLLLSIYHNVSDFLDIKPLIEDLELGYTFDVFKPVNGSVSGETLLICQTAD